MQARCLRLRSSSRMSPLSFLIQVQPAVRKQRESRHEECESTFEGFIVVMLH